MPTITQLAITETYLCPDASICRPHILASSAGLDSIVTGCEAVPLIPQQGDKHLPPPAPCKVLALQEA